MYSYIQRKHEERLAARYHLLREVLEPGMSEDEVLGILHQAGEFTLRKTDWTGFGMIELGINFTDPQGKALYGSFELAFFDYKYDRAYISNFDYIEVICDFPQTVEAATLTLYP